MSANDAEQLRQSLDQAISMQLNEMPRAIDLDPDEVLAQQIQQQELTTSITSTIPASARTRPQRAIQQADQDCSSCVENTRGRDLIVLECCQTAFCKICFRTWFETALDGKALPSCCGETIAPEGYGTNLTVAIKKKHGQVRAELNAERKIYCGNARCGKFIEIDDNSPPFVRCRYCKCKTCTSCKELMSAHGRRRTCPNYLNDEDIKQILANNEWKRCPSCYAPVEKIDGCSNVRCRCGTRFCFSCGDRKRSEGDSCSCSRAFLARHNPRLNAGVGGMLTAAAPGRALTDAAQIEPARQTGVDGSAAQLTTWLPALFSSWF